MKLNHLSHIRSYWNEEAARYAADHDEHLDLARHPSWGLFNLREDERRIVLDDLCSDGRVLDLGCGRGHDAVGYAMRGFNVVAVDISEAQLAMAISHERVEYVCTEAENCGLPDDSFDVVVSDHGSFDHSPPSLLLREVRRVLRMGGILAVCTYTPLAFSCYVGGHRPLSRKLTRPYPRDRVAFDGHITAVEYSYAGWIAEFRAAGFEILRLDELRPLLGSEAFFSELVTTEWASNWPCDFVWKVRKASLPTTSEVNTFASGE